MHGFPSLRVELTNKFYSYDTDKLIEILGKEEIKAYSNACYIITVSNDTKNKIQEMINKTL